MEHATEIGEHDAVVEREGARVMIAPDGTDVPVRHRDRLPDLAAGIRVRLQQSERLRGLRLRRVDQVRRHVMRRRRRPPGTQLLRAGERTRHSRLRQARCPRSASAQQRARWPAPKAAIEIERTRRRRATGYEVRRLARTTGIDAHRPDPDLGRPGSATPPSRFVPVERPSNPSPAFFDRRRGAVLRCAIAWTAYDFPDMASDMALSAPNSASMCATSFRG